MMRAKDYFALLHLREKLTKINSSVAARAIKVIDNKLNLKNYD